MSEQFNPKLLALNGQVQGHEYRIDKFAVAGRGSDCEISLEFNSISRRHAEFENRNGQCFVKDLGSRNGILVNGRQVHEARLKPGDVVSIGEIDLRFSADDGPAGVPAPRAAAAAPGIAPKTAPADAAAQAEPGETGINMKLVTVLVVTFVLSIVAGLLLLKLKNVSTKPALGELPPVKISVDETKWMKIEAQTLYKVAGKLHETKDGVGDFYSEITVADPQIVEAERYNPGELLLKGKLNGDTVITLAMANAPTTYLKMLVLVRGRVEDPYEPLTYGIYSTQERISLARQFKESGESLERMRPQSALVEYKKALAVLQPLSDKERGLLYANISNKKMLAEQSIDQRWDKLKNEISLSLTNNDRNRAVELLKEAEDLIPDQNDPRKQKAQWYLRVVNRHMEIEREGSR